MKAGGIPGFLGILFIFFTTPVSSKTQKIDNNQKKNEKKKIEK